MAETIDTMRAVVLTGHGGPEKLEYHDDWPRPVAGPGEALVRVGACGLNNTDVNTRTAWYSKGVTGGTTGASGGVGSALIQLANRRGARPVAMASADKVDAVRAVGPEAVLERSPDDLKAAIREAIGRDTVSVVADVVGGPMFPQVIGALQRGGRYTCSGAIAGPIVDLDLRTFYLKDLTFTGATVVPPGLFADLVGYINRGEIRPLLAATYPLAKLHDAQQAFIAKRHVGNIVVTMDA